MLYKGLCSVCEGDLSTQEVEEGTCQRTGIHLCFRPEDRLLEEFEEFFSRATGNPLRQLQRFWSRRVFSGESFTAVAPPGVGKTTFGILMALFMATRGKSAYILLPTTLLVRQTVENMGLYLERLNLRAGFNEEGRITICFYPLQKGQKKEAFLEMLSSQRYQILVTTSQYLARNFSVLKEKVFQFIFVDDVDSVLKGSRNVEKILHLLGLRKTKEGYSNRSGGVLMVSTATARAGRKLALLKEALGLDVGSSNITLRNIEDILCTDRSMNTLKKILTIMGPGGLIYTRTRQEAEELLQSLGSEFRIGLVTSETKEDYDAFVNGDIDYLVGTSSYYGSLVRGIDLPERVRFCVFWGAPVFTVRVTSLDTLPEGLVRLIGGAYREREEVRDLLLQLKGRRKEEALSRLRQLLRELLKEAPPSSDIILREAEVILPDIRTYIQGSGRTCRLFRGGLTKGASFLMEDDEDVLQAFVQRGRFYDIEFKIFHEVDFKRLREDLETSRSPLKETAQDLIQPTLFVVESPTKAFQISRFFGRPSVKVLGEGPDRLLIYEVAAPGRVLLITACIGHLCDLTTDEAYYGVRVDGTFLPVYTSIKRCLQCNYQFTEPRPFCPKCHGQQISDSLHRIKLLQRLAHQAGHIIVGTDPDTEGEKIAWDLRNLLAGCGVVERAEFHEVTPRAVMEALQDLRQISEPLVKAQMLRRIEDRWIGFSLSHILWHHFQEGNLSAGRAQTPVLGWIIDNAEAQKRKNPALYIEEYDLLLKEELQPSEIAEGETTIEVERIESTLTEVNPPPPYTTETMLSDANLILRLGAQEAMKVTQNLFESGLITYHRTDSTAVSQTGLKVAQDYLRSDFHPRRYASEGAHECIRPTRPIPKETLLRLVDEGVIPVEGFTWKEYALYDLVFRRFMASQCPPCMTQRERYRIKVSGKEFLEDRVVEAKGRAVDLYRWFIRVKVPLPEGIHTVRGRRLWIPEAYPFTESDIVRQMKQKGIGRPSTYATIIEKLLQRDYITKRNGRIYPTTKGRRVYDYLMSRFPDLLSEERTRLLEEKMDRVERGELQYEDCLRELYREVREAEERGLREI